MTDIPPAPAASSRSPLLRFLAVPDRFVDRLGQSARDVALLSVRVALAVPFFNSGLTKWDGFGRLSAGAIHLFTEEFRLHLFGAEVAYPLPKLMAAMAGSAEMVLPILLVAGLATRWAAFGLLVMTGIVQLTVPDGWANFHLPWAAMALAITVFGSGRVSVDRLLLRIAREPIASEGR